jgi:outer membrane protein OmpA-like peptidoglycan-associated protein
MAKLLPKGTRLRRSVSRVDIAGKTPAGVWVIVGMALFFVTGGLGTGAFIAWKAITEKISAPASDETASQRAKVALSEVNTSSAEVGVGYARSIVEVGDPLPAAASDRVEQDHVRQDVLKRIDLMPGLSDTEKDKLYVQVQRARGFTKIGIVRFTQAGTMPSTAQTAGLVTDLNEPGLRKLLADPTVILIMVGYADKQGEEAKNVEISRSRAENMIKALREKTDLVNIMHAVGMGGQDIFDPSNLDKNRLVEVWAVQP